MSQVGQKGKVLQVRQGQDGGARGASGTRVVEGWVAPWRRTIQSPYLAGLRTTPENPSLLITSARSPEAYPQLKAPEDCCGLHL